MKNYDLNYAISVRGLTFEQAGFYDPSMNPEIRREIIDLRTSIEIADYGNWPAEVPLAIEVLGGNLEENRKVTKEQWKNRYSNWRKYIRWSNESIEGFKIH